MPESLQPPAIQGLPPGPLSEVGESLRDAGLDLRIHYINLYSSTPDFGFTPGKKMNIGFQMFDATYHFTDKFKINLVETVNVATYNQDKYLFEVSNAFYATDPYADGRSDLTRLTLSAELFDHKLELEGGRLNMWPEFFRSEFCGGMGCIAQTRPLVLNGPGNTLAQWGGRVAYNLSPNLSLGAVVTEDNPENWQTGSGWDWSKGSSQGYTAVMHLAQREGFKDGDKPFNYEIGAYRRSADYTDALYGTGWGNPTFGPNQVVIEHDGGSNGVFAQARKVVWSQPDGTPFPENVALYGGAFHTFGDGQAYPWEAFAGAEYAGFWKENPFTSVGATIHYIGLSDERAAYETNARRFLTGITDSQPKDTFQFDVHTRIGIGAGFLELGAAYVIDPNTTVTADYSTSRMNDGWTFYAGVAFDIGTVLGLSKPNFP
ncbi:MAG: carbohydrate porin [Pseudomonas sp.]|uniref:carbohydrate porin n=1 Tax=Pseudomonas sp. TaxID=306 RepID=UPI003981A0D7